MIGKLLKELFKSTAEPLTAEKYEVKVIIFYKAPERKKSDTVQNGDIYKCLGHFNYIEICSLSDLSSKTPLERVWDNEKASVQQNERVGEYVLYALRTYRNPKAGRTDHIFVIVSRFHCDGKITDPKTEEKTYVSELEYRFGTHTDMEGEFYDSLELGDIVVLLYGDSLNDMFRAIQKLRTEEYVKDSYSYCGFRADTDILKEAENGKLQNMLEYASILYSIRNERTAQSFFEDIAVKVKSCEGRSVYLTGTADVMIDFPKGISEQQILCLADKAVSVEPSRTFDEVITHIGINDLPEFKSSKCVDQESTALSDFEKAIGWANVLKNENIIRFSWYKPLTRLLPVLRSMYNDCVMDDLAIILVPAVRALVMDIYKAAENGQLAQEEQSIAEIIEEWNALMNQITHLEGQLYQQPELHTAHVYIPAMVLLFEQSFIQKVAEVLNNDDFNNQNSAQFTPLLVPTLKVNSPKTYPYFDKNGYDSPVLIIKMHPELLYSPYDLSIQLCHELAHCCGVKLRDRGSRIDCLNRCFSITIQRLWKELTGGENPVTDTVMQEKINQKLWDEINILKMKPSMEDRESTGWITSEYQNAYNPVLLDEELFEEYVKKVITEKDDYADRKEMLFRTYLNRDLGKAVQMINHLRMHQELLMEFFSECYADIIMIILSKCDYNTYFRIIFEKEYERLRSMKSCDSPDDVIDNIDAEHKVKLKNYWNGDLINITFLKHIYRISFVTKAVGKVIKRWNTEKKEDFQCNWGKVAAVISQGKYEQVEFLDRGFPIAMNEIELMDEYFLGVAKAANEDFYKYRKDETKTITEKLDIINPEHFNWRELRKQAEKYECDYRDNLKAIAENT